MTRRAIQISIGTAAIATVILLTPAIAKKSNSNSKSLLPACYSVGCAPKLKEIFDPEAQMMISKLARNPELMNIEYLKYFIGRPHNEKHAKSSPRPHYFWYDAERRVKYELRQVQSAPGEVVESEMTVRLDGMGVTFEQLGAFYGQPVKRFYDYHARPAELYTFVPNTYLCFSSPPNTFRCSEAKITYHGPPLPPPSAADLALAENSLLAKSSVLAQDGLSSETLPTLQARVKMQPMDPEAHYLLGEVYRQQSQLHPAIAEYKVALALSANNNEIREKALNALRQMRVIDDYDATEKRKLELVHGGQALKARGQEKQDTMPPTAPPMSQRPPNSM